MQNLGFCQACGKETDLWCSVCESVFFCSAECQNKCWKKHSKVCQELAKKRQRQRQEMLLSSGSVKEWQQKRARRRAAAVQATREGRHKEALDAAASALEAADQVRQTFEAAQLDVPVHVAHGLQAESLIELLIVVRSALVTGDHAFGLSHLETLTATCERLVGISGRVPLLQPCAAATLLYSVSELCIHYGHLERAERYGLTFLAQVRVAHGEGSQAVGDAYGFLCALSVRVSRLDLALEHALMLLEIRKRCAHSGAERPVADALWNIGVIQSQLNKHEIALQSFKAARELHLKLAGDGKETATVDVAQARVYETLGQHSEAISCLRRALRTRQIAYGMAHSATHDVARRIAAIENAALGEIERSEEDKRKNVNGQQRALQDVSFAEEPLVLSGMSMDLGQELSILRSTGAPVAAVRPSSHGRHFRD